SFWWSRISASPRPLPIVTTSLSTARSLTASPIRNCKPIWKSCTPISACDEQREENFKEEANMKSKISALLLGTALVFAAANTAFAQGKMDKTIKIGVLSDMSGLYSDLGGPGSVVAAQMAVEDSGL